MLEVISHPLWGVIGFGLGFLLAHRLQLGRDRRAEFNAAAAPIRTWVKRQIHNPTMDFFEMPSREQSDAFESNLTERQYQKFRRHWNAMYKCYGLAHGKPNDLGEYKFQGSPEGLKHLKVLAKMLKKRW